MQRDGVCLSFCRYPQGKGQNKARDTFYRGRLGRPVCSSQHPVACALADASSTTLEIKLRRGAFFSCRPAEASDHRLAQAGRVDRVPLPDGPSPRLLLLLLAAEERGGSRLAQDSYFGGQIAEAKLLNCPHTLRHI
jgi:hypothetical protein